MSVGSIASLSSTVRAPPTPRSSAVTGPPLRSAATTCAHVHVANQWLLLAACFLGVVVVVVQCCLCCLPPLRQYRRYRQYNTLYPRLGATCPARLCMLSITAPVTKFTCHRHLNPGH
jgi:hypothetical protein